MGLSNFDMPLHRSLEIAAELSAAIKKYGRNATIPYSQPEVEKAFVTLYHDYMGCVSNDEYERTVQELLDVRAELKTAKQQAAGHKSVADRLRKKLKEQDD